MLKKKGAVHKFVVSGKDGGKRLDIFLAKEPHIPSRSFAQNLIKKGLVLVNGKKNTKHYHLKAGDEVAVTIPVTEKKTPTAEEIPLDIVYEDEDIMVISKPAGLVVHPATGHPSGTLVNAILAHYPSIAEAGAEDRPGIVHRLDKDTSGLIVVAKTDAAHLSLARQIKEREVKRTYLALVQGCFDKSKGIIEAPIGRSVRDRKKMAVMERKAREATTRFEVKEEFDDYSLLEVELETGRTHQIRVHFSFADHPVVGDPQYGYRKRAHQLGLKRQFLHAHRLELIHPHTGRKRTFKSPLPPDLKEVLEALHKNKKKK